MRQNKLTFPILSDVRGKVAAAFGLRLELPAYLVELYKSLKNDLPTFNDDPSWSLPMPARYVIDRDGKILYSEVNPDYTRRPEPEDMIPVLQRAVGCSEPRPSGTPWPEARCCERAAGHRRVRADYAVPTSVSAICPAFAPKESDFEQSFESGHLPAYRTLSQRKFVRGAREAEMSRGCLECDQQRH